MTSYLILAILTILTTGVILAWVFTPRKAEIEDGGIVESVEEVVEPELFSPKELFSNKFSYGRIARESMEEAFGINWEVAGMFIEQLEDLKFQSQEEYRETLSKMCENHQIELGKLQKPRVIFVDLDPSGHILSNLAVIAGNGDVSFNGRTTSMKNLEDWLESNFNSYQITDIGEL